MDTGVSCVRPMLGCASSKLAIEGGMPDVNPALWGGVVGAVLWRRSDGSWLEDMRLGECLVLCDNGAGAKFCLGSDLAVMTSTPLTLDERRPDRPAAGTEAAGFYRL